MFTDISTLVKKAREGDQKALEDILLQLRPFVIKHAKAVFIKGYEMEDLIQIGNLSIIKALRQYEEKPGRNFISYAITAIKNNYYYEIRQKCKTNDEANLHNGAEDAEDWIYSLPDSVNVEEELVRKENRRELREVLDKLSAEEKELIDAVYFKEMTLKKYADLKEISYITLVKRRNRLLRRMRKELGKE